MPKMTTIWLWTRQIPEFLEQYHRAREEQADALAEEMVDVVRSDPVCTEMGNVDTGLVAHNRLLIDTLKWRAARLKPKVYGDKVQNEHSGPDGGPIQVTTGVPLK